MISQKTKTFRGNARSSSFDGSVKRVKSFFSKKKKTSFDQSDPEFPRPISGAGSTERKSIRSEIGKTGPVCKTRKKAAEVVELVEQEEIDLDEQIRKERCSTDCMWLTSDSSSPSYFFEEYRLSTSLHPTVDEWLISWLSTLANSYVHLDGASSISNKSRILLNPEEDAASTVGRTVPDLEMILQEDLKEERRFSLISKSCRRKIDFSVSSSESSSSTFEHCCGNFTSSTDNSATPRSTTFGSPSCSSRTSDLDRMSFSVSLLSLDGDDSKWDSDTELESEILKSTFPSPSCWRRWSSGVLPSSSNVSIRGKFKDGHLQHDISLENSSSEAEVMKDFNTDGPLFWPFDKKLDWNSEEVWKCFAMSPRKDMMELSIYPQGISSESVGVKIHDRKMESKVGCRRRLVFSSGSAASNIVEKKQREDNNSSTKKINSKPTRLKNSTKGKDRKVSAPKVDSENRNLSKDDFIASNKEHPIEILLGLGEFDGHEGVDSEVNEGFFSLDDSP
ncbi:unnamed protein product [Dovyalis caffra]|uniref:Uncharacterized protein n=1 Tax=Dovyalis caffra TaxID=77055 RepID=A0AAV1QNT4_9ROSI|nr:unnamed protein product [Dovyalis caffra]